MKKICIVTSARSEYGLLKWLMKDIRDSNDFMLQIIVTGAHLSYEQGHTVDELIEDGFNIDYKVDTQLNIATAAKIAESMGVMAEGFAKAFELLKPDYLLVLGDRYELLPVCNTAFVMCIPIIHLSGGDITEGAIDDGIRNAVTMLSEYHFPGTEVSFDNVVRMIGTEKNVWVVGEPGLDSFNRENLMNKNELARELDLDINKQWVLMTYHPETKESLEYNLDNVKNCMECLIKEDNLQTVITYANADYGGKQINEYLENFSKIHQQKLRCIPSLGHKRYLSIMKYVYFIIGNSSSGIVETPFLNVPAINIGNRQKGRYQCSNIIQCPSNYDSINNSINMINNVMKTHNNDKYYWGDGHTSEKIVAILKKELL